MTKENDKAETVGGSADDVGTLFFINPSLTIADAVTISHSGEVRLHHGDDLTEAARAFWAEVGKFWHSENDALKAEVARLSALASSPPPHLYWRPGEPDCPREIKAPNGELHTLRCKVCGLDDPMSRVCLPLLNLAPTMATSATVDTWEGSDAAKGEG